MTSVKLNGKRYKVASCWEEVTVKQYVRILTEWEPEKDIADRNYFILLNILVNGQFSRYEANIENQVSLTILLGWVITQPFQFSKERPKVLDIAGKKIPIPSDMRDMSIGQNIYLRRDYIDKSKVIEQSISIATAIYLQPIMDGKKFDIGRAQELALIIDEMPISLIYPVGFFLLSRVMKFGQKPESILQQVRNNLKKRLSKLSLTWRRFIS